MSDLRVDVNFADDCVTFHFTAAGLKGKYSIEEPFNFNYAKLPAWQSWQKFKDGELNEVVYRGSAGLYRKGDDVLFHAASRGGYCPTDNEHLLSFAACKTAFEKVVDFLRKAEGTRSESNEDSNFELS